LSNFSSLLGSAIAKILWVAATLHLDNCGGLLPFRFGISNAMNGATHTKRPPLFRTTALIFALAGG
jgi:hypothetical protein